MALDRKHQKIFGANAQETDLGVVGSKNAGNPQYSTDIETLQSLSNWGTGLRALVTSTLAPYLQDQNSIFYVITSQLAYLFQAGVAEWNSQTEYIANRSAVFKNGKIYIATANSTNIEPEVTTGWDGYWIDLLSSGTESFVLENKTVGAAKDKVTITLNDQGRVRITNSRGLSFPCDNNTFVLLQIDEATRNVDLSANSFTINSNPIIRLPDYTTKTLAVKSTNTTVNSWTAATDCWILATFIGLDGSPSGNSVLSINSSLIYDNNFHPSGEQVISLFPLKQGDIVRVRRGIAVYRYTYR